VNNFFLLKFNLQIEIQIVVEIIKWPLNYSKDVLVEQVSNKIRL